MKKLLLLLLFVGCQGDPLGKPCTDDAQCGPGFDCYKDSCHQVCTQDEQCRAERKCLRYRCIDTQRASSEKQPTTTPSNRAPDPNATAAELRAIRRELETLRRSIDSLLAAQGLQKAKRPADGTNPAITPDEVAPKPAPAPK